ncbi:MAG: hypothetical protein AB2L24_04770 [Mangrovibacterium sp.]
MNVYLLHKDRDSDPHQKLPWNEQALTQDLELNTLFKAMAQDDDFLFEAARRIVLSGVNNDRETILYRQEILKDCLKNTSVIRDIYALAVESIEKERKNYWGIFSKYPGAILYRSTEVLEMFVDMLRRLRSIADEHAGKFDSAGFRLFFAILKRELTDDYFVSIRHHLSEVKFRDGVLISARLGKGNKGADYTLRKWQGEKLNWWKRLIKSLILPNLSDNNEGWFRRMVDQDPSAYTFYISSRDESSVRALRALEEEGINLVANALAQSCDHILGFFKNLRTELAFYLGCLNLYDQLILLKEPVSFPDPVDGNQQLHVCNELYDVCLVLTMKKKVVGNAVNAGQKSLVVITGANQGGKSTFLRSIGLAQLMMQCGLFVPAGSFRANICDSLITHFRREEDSEMKSGKLDEELARMDQIVERITPNTLFLFNESFAATNEREGSEIAGQIVSALLEHGIKVFFVTHLYEFAHAFYEREQKKALFLRAERQIDGTRSFRLTEGEPLQTSYGEDLYHTIF